MPTNSYAQRTTGLWARCGKAACTARYAGFRTPVREVVADHDGLGLEEYQESCPLDARRD